MGHSEVRDHRAVEDPIGAIFDLSDQVSEEAARIKKMVLYATIFISFFLFLDFLLFLGEMLKLNVITSLFFLILFILGAVSLRLLRRMNRFFAYYVLRQRAIRSVRDSDPVVHIPQGASAADRALNRLRSSLPWLRKDLGQNRARAASQGILQGASGTFYTFDRAIVRKPSFSGRLLHANHGYAIGIKVLETTPQVKDLRAMGKAARDIAAGSKVPFYRLIMVWPQSEEGVGDRVYELATTRLVTFRMGHLRKRTYTAPVELWAEVEDGTYDLIPYMST